MTKFDQDIPMPSAREEYKHYGFDQMLVGDSLYVVDPDGKTAHRIQTQLSTLKRKGDEKRYTTRRVADGVRVWRIK